MLNDKNLKPIEHLSSEEAKRRGSKGGKASVETRRRKKALKSLMNDLLSSDIVNDDIYNSTVDMGCNDPTYGAAVVAAMVRQAALGDTKAFNAIVDLIGEGSSGERVKLQKKQVALQEKKLSGEEEQTPDDGFLSALDGSAQEDWNDED